MSGLLDGMTATKPRVLSPVGEKAAKRGAERRAARKQSAAVRKARVDAQARSAAKLTGPFWELQLNLCNSGLPTVKCYANGDAIYEGGDLIYYLAPDVVTLNEICADDIGEYLQLSLAEAWPNDSTYSWFVPAVDKRTGTDYKCADGNAFGNAVIGRLPAGSNQGAVGYGGRYTAQDSGNEQRTFACVYAKNLHLACTTHLTSTSKTIALEQCRTLMFNGIPLILQQEGFSGRTVMGGDLNLKYDSTAQSAQNCVPSGHARKGDGSVQHVIYSNDMAASTVTTETYGLTHTDHDGFLVKLNQR